MPKLLKEQGWLFQGFCPMRVLHGKVFPSSDIMSILKNFQLKSSIFERLCDVTWWEKPVFHGVKPVFHAECALDQYTQLCQWPCWVQSYVGSSFWHRNGLILLCRGYLLHPLFRLVCEAQRAEQWAFTNANLWIWHWPIFN